MEYIIAKYFYDNEHFFDFLDRCKVAAISIPILTSIMPIYSVKIIKKSLAFARLP